MNPFLGGNRNWSPARRHRQRMKKSGLCIQCGLPALTVRCRKCLIRDRETKRRKFKFKRQLKCLSRGNKYA